MIARPLSGWIWPAYGEAPPCRCDRWAVFEQLDAAAISLSLEDVFICQRCGISVTRADLMDWELP